MQINGKRYNTDKAQKCACFENETLYRKKTGEYFLTIGEGAVLPLKLEEAKEWARRLDQSEYERLFTVKGGNKKKLVSFTISPETHEKIKRIAAEKGIPAGEVIDQAFTD